MKNFDNVQVRFYKAKKLPNAYFATNAEVNTPKFRSAKPSANKNRYGAFKSGKILSVRYCE